MADSRHDTTVDLSAQDARRELQQPPGKVDQQAPHLEVDANQLGEFMTELARLCHKINNPLTAVMGRTQMMQMKLRKQGGDESMTKSVGVVEDSARRVSELVQQLACVVNDGRKRFVEPPD